MGEDEGALPLGGVTLKKYAALMVALGVARQGIFAALHENNPAEASRIFEITGLSRIAQALDCKGDDLAILWDE